MPRNALRLTGIFTSAGLLLAVFLLFRTPHPPPDGPILPQHGGQVIGSIRAPARSFNRIAATDPETDLLSLLTQGKLVRINHATFDLEPWLAERWESSGDGRTHTLHLRQGVTWSDGTPFTADDVLFSMRAAFDPRAESGSAGALKVAGQPIRAAARDPHTIVLTYPSPSGQGLRLLDHLTVLPKHKLQAALDAGTFRSAWSIDTPPSEIVGTGPFVVREVQGQRIVLERNPRYWRKASNGDRLPYLDRIVLEVVSDPGAELTRLRSGEIDLMSELRPEDYATADRALAEGKLKMMELGVSIDPGALWFCLKPEAKAKDPRFAFVQKPEFRQALSHAVDREMLAKTVFSGAAVPVWGPVTPGNRLWFWAGVTRYRHDTALARELLKSIGLEDRNGNGIVEDASGTEARFTVVTEKGVASYERSMAFISEEAKKAGIALDVTPVEEAEVVRRLPACDYDAMYFRTPARAIDPAGNTDFWLSSGHGHVWNPGQKTPATDWERRIDTLMLEQAATIDPGRRRETFNIVQRIVAENLPVLYFAAPRIYYAHSPRVLDVLPSVLPPPALWNADMISVAEKN